jgi:hypothetical protein
LSGNGFDPHSWRTYDDLWDRSDADLDRLEDITRSQQRTPAYLNKLKMVLDEKERRRSRIRNDRDRAQNQAHRERVIAALERIADALEAGSSSMRDDAAYAAAQRSEIIYQLQSIDSTIQDPDLRDVLEHFKAKYLK